APGNRRANSASAPMAAMVPSRTATATPVRMPSGPVDSPVTTSAAPVNSVTCMGPPSFGLPETGEGAGTDARGHCGDVVGELAVLVQRRHVRTDQLVRPLHTTAGPERPQELQRLRTGDQ